MSMRPIVSWKGPSRGLDFMPAMVAIVLLFVIVAVVQLSGSLPNAERGLLLFEKACKIHSSAS